MKNQEVLTTLTKLQCISKLHVSGRVSLVISRNKIKLAEIVEAIEDTREKICNTYADKDEQGKAIMVPNGMGGTKYKLTPENELKLNKEYTELLGMEANIEGLQSYDKSVIEAYADSLEAKQSQPTPEQFEALDIFSK